MDINSQVSSQDKIAHTRRPRKLTKSHTAATFTLPDGMTYKIENIQKVKSLQVDCLKNSTYFSQHDLGSSITKDAASNLISAHVEHFAFNRKTK
ncbi:hypothetical protein EB796_002551 [Bugula neritina]|uniref:Uncharacterized protein n=1 Tax=Bugula neritina TaxID=10212 RepID=A0A7J7KLM7_BUGNE|nr:hypothetical protein EB796_002551 [Bugula neritina]